MSIENKRREVLFSKEQISSRVVELGAEIAEVYKEKNLLVVSLLKGSFIFTADLVRAIDIPVRIEFMTTSSYGHSEESSGNVKVVQDLDVDLSGYDVLVVDDITDSGITMKAVLEHLGNKNPKSIKSCVLLDKPSRRKVELEADYVGYTIPDKFIVGYGLNYGDYFRNIDHIFAFVD
ncbi:MAG: hypoxanthine phosphoribosyltransferase [Firmicutes bacterium]|jgi:hypoxanthine phosphoribosyltransferase|nr:hypoxanthine phosphoribosyltransferase [Bacillota bacterium]